MQFEIVLTEDAERDLEDIFTYIATHDSQRNAEQVLSRILEIAGSLTNEPARGSQPKELRSLGDQEYRQIFFKPYRVIYRVVGRQVVVYLVTEAARHAISLDTPTPRRLTTPKRHSGFRM
jgi:toxin ParE1/3/4